MTSQSSCPDDSRMRSQHGHDAGSKTVVVTHSTITPDMNAIHDTALLYNYDQLDMRDSESIARVRVEGHRYLESLVHCNQLTWSVKSFLSIIILDALTPDIAD